MAKEETTTEEKTKSEGILSNVARAVKEGIIGSLKGLNEIQAEIVNVARDTVTGAVKATSEVTSVTINSIVDIVKGSIQAGEETGTD